MFTLAFLFNGANALKIKQQKWRNYILLINEAVTFKPKLILFFSIAFSMKHETSFKWFEILKRTKAKKFFFYFNRDQMIYDWNRDHWATVFDSKICELFNELGRAGIFSFFTRSTIISDIDFKNLWEIILRCKSQK